MLIDIEKVVVKDRIRKDFGNLQELADDIKENGLINPPVVTPDTFELIAGERRLRALKLLGYKQIEVRPMPIKDAEHALLLEISENEVRKDFSKAERIEYARRLERVLAVKARERQVQAGYLYGENHSKELVENFPQALAATKTRDTVAEQLGIGSGKQYQKEKFIVDNKSSLTPEDFADWDEGVLSTNKAYKKIKDELNLVKKQNEQLTQEQENYKQLLSSLPQLENLVDTGVVTQDLAKAILNELSPEEQTTFIESLDTTREIMRKRFNSQLESLRMKKEENEKLKKDAQFVERYREQNVEFRQKIEKHEAKIESLSRQLCSVSNLYERLKESKTEYKDKPETLQQLDQLKQELDTKIQENQRISELLIEKQGLLNQAMGSSTNYQLISHCSEITGKMSSFIQDMSKYDYMAESFNEIPNATRIEYEKSITSIKKWADRILETIKTENI